MGDKTTWTSYGEGFGGSTGSICHKYSCGLHILPKQNLHSSLPSRRPKIYNFFSPLGLMPLRPCRDTVSVSQPTPCTCFFDSPVSSIRRRPQTTRVALFGDTVGRSPNYFLQGRSPHTQPPLESPKNSSLYYFQVIPPPALKHGFSSSYVQALIR